MSITTLQRALLRAAADDTRVTVKSRFMPIHGYVRVDGYTETDLIYLALCDESEWATLKHFDWVSIAHIRGAANLNRVNLSWITQVITSAKDRRLNQQRVLWQPNPFVMTSSGAIDIAGSLKELLGVA